VPRTINIAFEHPDRQGVTSSVRTLVDDIAVTPSGVRWVKWGVGAYDWKLEGDASGGGPFRTAQTPTDSKAPDNDPHRAWLIANADWKYTEMDWSDKFGVPARIQWVVDGAVAELRTNAMTDNTGNRLRVVKPRLGGIKDISIGDRDAGGKWRPDADGHWWTEFPTQMTPSVGRPMFAGKDTAIRDRAVPLVRAFLDAYAEIAIKYRDS
jgi:hypothetical protein